MSLILIACAASAAVAGAAGWKAASAWWGSRVAQAQADKKATDVLLATARDALEKTEAQLARERVVWSAEEQRRDELEKRLRADADALREELKRAASRDPALAGDRLDDVLSRGAASVTARGNAPAGYHVPRAPPPSGRKPGGDDPPR